MEYVQRARARSVRTIMIIIIIIETLMNGPAREGKWRLRLHQFMALIIGLNQAKQWRGVDKPESTTYVGSERTRKFSSPEGLTGRREPDAPATLPTGSGRVDFTYVS